MKHTSLLAPLAIAAALSLALCAACRSDKGKDLSDYPDATQADSMLYYYAQVQAYDYLKDAVNDTSKRSAEQREMFLDGVKAGFSAVRMGATDETYNVGVRRGARMAMKFLEFEKAYNLDLHDEIIIEAITRVLEDTTIKIDPLKAQSEYQRLITGIRSQYRDNNRKFTEMNLIEQARKYDLVKISPNLYYKVVRKGSGPYVRIGDALTIETDYQKADGVNLGMPSSERVVVGAPGIPQIMEKAYLHLNLGSKAIFATTAESVYGGRAEILGLQPDDVLIITLSARKIEHGHLNSPDDDNEQTPQ